MKNGKHVEITTRIAGEDGARFDPRSVVLETQQFTSPQAMPDATAHERSAIIQLTDPLFFRPFGMPKWGKAAIRRGRHEWPNDGQRLADCVALMFPPDIAPQCGEISCFSGAAVSCTDESEKRAADACEQLMRRGYTIPRDVIMDHRATCSAGTAHFETVPESTDE